MDEIFWSLTGGMRSIGTRMLRRRTLGICLFNLKMEYNPRMVMLVGGGGAALQDWLSPYANFLQYVLPLHTDQTDIHSLTAWADPHFALMDEFPFPFSAFVFLCRARALNKNGDPCFKWWFVYWGIIPGSLSIYLCIPCIVLSRVDCFG